MMLAKIVQFIQQVVKATLHVAFIASSLLMSAAYAQSVVPNLAQMMANFTATVPELMRLVTAIAYVLGMVFCIKGVMGLKSFGESRTHHEQGGAKMPLLALAVGAALLYLPSSVQTAKSTFWDSSLPYQLTYVSSTASAGPWADLITDVFYIVQFVGTIAFIRGLIMLTHLGGHGGHQATLGKALTHMIAGIFCINMYQFLQTILNTLALGST